MTVPVRIAFNTKLPFVVTTAEVNIGGVIVKDGETLDWKRLGISEQNVFDMWRAGLLAHMPEAPGAGAQASDARVSKSSTTARKEVAETEAENSPAADAADEDEDDDDETTAAPRTSERTTPKRRR